MGDAAPPMDKNIHTFYIIYITHILEEFRFLQLLLV